MAAARGRALRRRRVRGPPPAPGRRPLMTTTPRTGSWFGEDGRAAHRARAPICRRPQRTQEGSRSGSAASAPAQGRRRSRRRKGATPCKADAAAPKRRAAIHALMSRNKPEQALAPQLQAWCLRPHITRPPPRLMTWSSTSTMPTSRQASKIRYTGQRL